MDVFLWRHADTLTGVSDFERELSPVGHQKARKTAEWFREHVPAFASMTGLRILVSPALRTRQTVAHFCEDENVLELCPPLYENSSPAEILAIIGWPSITLPTLVVGHQPMMGMLADRLLAGTPHPPSFRTGAFWWLQLEPGKNQLVQVFEP